MLLIFGDCCSSTHSAIPIKRRNST